MSSQICYDLNALTSRDGSGIELRCEEVLTNILQQCSARFFKHVTRFLNELKQAQCPPDTRLRFPVFSTKGGTTESSTDVNHLGPYNHESHQAYMQLSCERLCHLRRICVNLTTSVSQPNVPQMILLAKAAYHVRRSSSFDRFLQHNLLASQKPVAVQSMAENLKERLGKISRFWRAATSLISFGSILLAQKIAVQVSCLPASKQTVHELCKRTTAQLHSRGGRHFESCNDVQLQQKLRQWPRCRLHCEMQLVVFYQENPHLRLRSRYIGCDKLACYLCHAFITTHGHFQVKGCHQGLYSLWTVPRTISFEKHDRALEFQSALRHLANILEGRMDTLRKAPKLQWKYRTNHESTANLSRISIQLPIITTIPPAFTELTAEASDTMGSRKSSQSGNTRTSGHFRIIENPGEGHGPDTGEVDQNQSAQSRTARTKADGSATQSAKDSTSSYCPFPAFSTTEAQRSQEDHSLAKQSYESYSVIERNMNWQASQLNTCSPTPSHTSKSVSTVPLAADTSIVPSLFEDTKDTDAVSLISWCQELQRSPHSPERRQKQVRSFTYLDYEQYDQAARLIGDHESRTCDIPSERCASKRKRLGGCSMQHSDGMSRRIDFHDMELSLEIQYPKTMQMIVLQCRRPDDLASKVVVDIDKLQGGEELEIDTCQNQAVGRVMFLARKNDKGIERWWEFCWNSSV